MKFYVFCFFTFLLSSAVQASFSRGEKTFDFPNISPSKENWSQIDWNGLHFEDGKKTINPEFGSLDWNLRIKSGYLSTNQGVVCVLKGKQLKDVTQAPDPSECKYVADTYYDEEGPAPEDTYNKNLMKWFKYIFTGSGGCSHIFAVNPDELVFVIKTPTNNYAKVKFIDSVKERKRVTNVLGLGFGQCQDVNEPASIYAADRVYVKLEYVYNQNTGDKALE